MVVLTRLLLKLPRPKVDITLYSYDQICRGQDAIKDLIPLSIINFRKTPKKPAPGFKMRYESFVLGNSFKVRATLGLQREIDRVGGFDRYIYYTPEDKLRSQLARSLRLRMLERTERYPQAVPPPLNKRNPQPVPKNLTKGLEPVEVCILNKFVYLG